VGDALVFGLAGRKAALGPINATADRSGARATIKLAFQAGGISASLLPSFGD
jgi:hypothetical protein